LLGVWVGRNGGLGEREGEGERETRVNYPIADRQIWEMGTSATFVPGARQEATMETAEEKRK
jgi:hypothetical protein